MTLLRQLQDAAANSSVSMGELLRKTKILATRLGNDDLKEWVDLELNGYREVKGLPDYRVFRGAEIAGTFVGPFGSGVKNGPVPLSTFPEVLREQVSTVFLTEPIGAYEEIARGQSEGVANFPFPTDMALLLSNKVYRGMQCLAAWQVIPKGVIVALIETVRNKILGFALDLESKVPDAGETAPGTKPVDADERVTNAINVHIHGGTNVVAAGTGFVQTVNEVQTGNLDSLKCYLSKLGLDANDVAELEVALKEEKKPTGKGFGVKVSAWFGKMMSKAASGALRIAPKIASTLLEGALHSFWGIQFKD